MEYKAPHLERTSQWHPKLLKMDLDHFLLYFHCLPLVSVKTFSNLLAQGFGHMCKPASVIDF
jgi:hypothetical protein